MAEAKKKETGTEPDFEASLARLEKIVEEMESGSLSLEKMMAHFEEGSALVQLCGKKLNEVEKKIEILVKKGGELTTQPFAPPAGEG